MKTTFLTLLALAGNTARFDPGTMADDAPLELMHSGRSNARRHGPGITCEP